MNQTELNTLRRSLWLTREQAGKLNGMTERSWRYLENGTRAIPEDVQARMRDLDRMANAIAEATWDEGYGAIVKLDNDWKRLDIVLLRYADADDIAAFSRNERIDIPVDLHAAAIDRARILLEKEGARVHIVAFDPVAYTEWFSGDVEDSPEQRAAWAKTVVDPVPKLLDNKASGEDKTT